MGAYLSCGIAKGIHISKEGRYRTYSKEEILQGIEKEIELNNYDIEETESSIHLEMKPEIFEKNVVPFIIEQLKKRDMQKRYVKEDLEEIESLKGKKYNELIEIAKNKTYRSFQLIEGCRVTNDISYIVDGKFFIYADIVIYILDGKAFMECYSNTFYYFRKTIMDGSSNCVKSSVVITID